MKTIDGKTINLNDVIIYNIVKELGEERIAIALRYEDGTLEKSRVIYTEENLNELVRGMKQISKMDIIEGEKIKVKYTDGTYVEFPVTRVELLIKIQEKQNKIKNSKIIEDNWDETSVEKVNETIINEEPLTKEQEKAKKSNNQKFNRTIAGILAGTVLFGSAYLLGKKSDDINETNKEPQEQTTPVPTKQPATHSFDINNRKVLEQQSAKLFDEVMSKDIEYLTSGQVMMTSAGGIVTFDETLSLEIIEYLQGLYPQNMTTMSVEDANIEREKIEQAIILICASHIKSNNDTTKVLDLSKYISNSEEKALFKDALTYSKNVWDERGKVALLGKVIDSEEEFDKVNRRYIAAEENLQHFVRRSLVSQAYSKASPLTQRSIIAPLQIGIAGIRHWSFVVDKSQDETVVAECPFIYYIDNRNNTTWEPKKPETSKDLDLEGQEVYIEINENGVATGKDLTITEMEAYDEANDNIVKRGTEKFFEDELQRVIVGIQNKIELGSTSKSK